MNKQRKTSHILNVFQYDADGHVILPASLTLSIAPTSEDNSGKVPTTAWVRSIVGGTVTAYTPTSRTITINGTSYDLSSNRAWSIDTGVLTATAGSGISVSVVNQNLNIVNTGILTASSGAGISLSVVNQNLNVVNTGILTASAGLGISLSVVGQNLNVVNTGILTASAGSGISLSVVDQNLNVVNTGILTATAGAGISLSVVNGNLNVVNTITNNNQLTNGAGYITSSALTGYATETYVGTAISNLVDAAPGTLDTLNELAAALGDDPNFATTIATSIGTKQAQLNGTGFVKVTGTTVSYDNSTYLTTSSAASTYVALAGSYANPSWITSLAWSKITSTPTTISGYGITNAYTDAQIQNFFNGANAITGYNKSNWDTAYGWGNHASAGYLTSYTETDTLASVTARGASTSTSVTFNGVLNFAAVGNVSFTSNDASSYPRFTGSYSSAQIGLFRSGSAVGGMYIGGTGTGFYVFDSSFNTRLLINQNGDTAFNSSTVTVGGNQVLHLGSNTVPQNITLNTNADNWMWLWQASSSNSWYIGPTTANFGIGGNRLAISSSGSSPNAELVIERGTTRLLEVLQANLQYKGNVVLHAGNYTSYSPSLTGSGASGTWGIRITGFANQGSQRLYSTDSAYNYDAANPYFGYLTYDGTYWHFKVSPATPANVRVYTADTLGGVSPNQTGGANTIVQRDANGYIQNSYFYSSGGGSERNGSGLGYVAGFNSSDYYIRSYNSTAVASFLGLGSMAYASTGSYLPLSGGTMTGTLAMHQGAYYGTITFGSSDYWRAGISMRDASNAELRIWAKGGAAGSIYFATGFDGESSATTLPADGMALKNNSLGIGGWAYNEFPSYKLHVKGDIYASAGWVRVAGSSGLYFESYGGGWRMTGSSYIESYGSKSLHMNGASVDYVGSLYFSGAGHIQPNAGSYGALQMTSNKNGWAGIRFTDYNTNLMTNSTTSGFHHNDYGWQFKWDSGNAYVYSGTYGGGSAYTVIHSGNIGSQSVSYASSAGSASNATTLAGVGISTIRGGISSNSISFYVNGDANTYYPVVLSLGGQFGMNRYSVSRGYADPAPWDPIGTGSHKGGLTLTFDASSDIAWGGNDKSWRIIQFHEQYTNMVAGMALPVTDGIIVWLRGGGAYYTYQGPSGINHSATVYLSGYTGANGATYPVRTSLSSVDGEIRAKWPIRGFGDGDMYVNNQTVIHTGNLGSQTVFTTLYHNGNTRLYTGSDGTRNTGWAYHTDNGTGIHWPNNGWHFYPKSDSDMYVRGGNGSNVALTMNTAGTNRGYVYADSSNQIGFLNQNRDWIFRMTSGGDAYAVSYYSSASTSKYFTSNGSSYGTWYIGGNNGGYSGFRVDGGMQLMIHTNGASGPTGFWMNNWSILTYVDAAQYLYNNGYEKFRTASDGIVVTGTVYATGDVIAYYSDIRLKKDVTVIDSALDKIKQLRGVTYTWNDEEVNKVKERAGTKDIGLIAQEVEAVEPLLITEYQTQLNTPDNDPDKAADFVPIMSETYKTIKYEKLVALLVEAIKEQQKQIEELQNKLDNVLSSR